MNEFTLMVLGVFMVLFFFTSITWAVLRYTRNTKEHPDPRQMPSPNGLDKPAPSANELEDFLHLFEQRLGASRSYSTNVVTFDSSEPDGHHSALTIELVAHDHAKARWTTTLIAAPDAPFDKQAPDASPIEHLRSRYLRLMLEDTFPKKFYGSYKRTDYRQTGDTFELDLEFYGFSRGIPLRLIPALREFRERIEQPLDDVLDSIFYTINMNLDERPMVRALHDMLREYEQKLTEQGDIEGAQRIEKRINDHDTLKQLEALTRESSELEPEDVQELVRMARDLYKAGSGAGIALAKLVDSQHRPEGWLELLVEHARSLGSSRSLAYATLLREAPDSPQAMKITEERIQDLTSNWDIAVDQDPAALEALSTHLDALLKYSEGSSWRAKCLFAAINAGLAPGRYKEALDALVKEVVTEQDRSKNKILLSLIEQLREQLERDVDATLFFTPLFELARCDCDLDVRIVALECLSSEKFVGRHVPFDTYRAILEGCDQYDTKLYKSCAEQLIANFSPDRDDLAALESIIRAERVESSVELALEAYPRETAAHYNFLLTVSEPPEWLANAIVRELATFEDFAALTPGLEHFMRSCSWESYLWRVMEITAKRNIEPFGRHYDKISRFDGFSDELREFASDLKEQWDNRKAHLVGGLSLDESPGAGQLTMTRGESGGLSVHHEDREG